MVAAGEALNPEVLKVWRDATGLDIRDGYGQTETGQMTGMGIGVRARAGSMGKALPGVRLSVIDGELVADPASVPTFFLGYLGEGVRREPDGSWTIADRRKQGPWHTGDRVSEDEDGYLHFEGPRRRRDRLRRLSHRPVRGRVGARRPCGGRRGRRGERPPTRSAARWCARWWCCATGYAPSPELARELQEHVKRETAPYKYPRIVEFVEELPKTASGKVKRAELRGR